VGNLPVAVGAGQGVDRNGVNNNGGTAGLSRSAIQNNPAGQFTGVGTNVSAIPSRNPNETAALYRPGGTYAVFFEETKALTVSMPRYQFRTGITSSGTLGNVAFTFNGNIVRIQTPNNGVVNFLYLSDSAQAGNTNAVGSQVANVTFPLPDGTNAPAQTVTILSRQPIAGLLPQGFYVIRDAQTRQFAGVNPVNGNVTIAANSALVVQYDSNTQQYDANGIAIYFTELVKPPTFNPPNGTTTGELTGADVVSPYTTTGKISVYPPDFATFGTNSIGPSGQGFSTLPLPSRP
jgi:hypothetical protein